MKKLLLLASIVLFTMATIGTVSTKGDLKVNEALAAGDCCDEDKSTCFPTGCHSSDCSEEDKYWKSDGKCDDSVLIAVEAIGIR